ncbi:MAG: peptidylprolyl isomerase [Planctomycetota bacterium]|nr:MAG: peptidylprolyl isomerase [Planctomycetota bacterium]
MLPAERNPQQNPSVEHNTIARGSVVTLSYAMSCDGERIEETETDEPLVYLHGTGALVPGLERALEGCAIGERLDLVLGPEQAFGRSDPNKIEYLPRSAFPADAELELGMQFGAEDQNGDEVAVWITDIDAERVCVNGNHPLVDQTLRFEVEVLAVRAATEAELEHGHAHEEGAACEDEEPAGGACGSGDCGCHE